GGHHRTGTRPRAGGPIRRRQPAPAGRPRPDRAPAGNGGGRVTAWHKRPFVSFDTETTGKEAETVRIVSAAVVTVDPVSGSHDVRQWLADPGIDIPAEAAAIHGITTEHAREHGQPAADVVHEIADYLEEAWRQPYPVVVYNAPYDFTVVDRELRRYDQPPLNMAAVV